MRICIIRTVCNCNFLISNMPLSKENALTFEEIKSPQHRTFPKTPIYSPRSTGSYTPIVIKQQETQPVFVFPEKIEEEEEEPEENIEPSEIIEEQKEKEPKIEVILHPSRQVSILSGQCFRCLQLWIISYDESILILAVNEIIEQEFFNQGMGKNLYNNLLLINLELQ